MFYRKERRKLEDHSGLVTQVYMSLDKHGLTYSKLSQVVPVRADEWEYRLLDDAQRDTDRCHDALLAMSSHSIIVDRCVGHGIASFGKPMNSGV